MQYEYYRRSPASPSDEMLFGLNVTTLNLPLLAALGNPLAAIAIETFKEFLPWRDPSALFITRTAEEVLFGWHDDPLLVLLKQFVSDIPTFYTGVQVSHWVSSKGSHFSG